MITIIDYGMGNLRSVEKAFEKFYSDVRVSSVPEDIVKAGKIVLPGVGAFKMAMDELEKRRLIEPLKEAIQKGKPFLGICLGLQLLFSESEEGGKVKGLDIIKGKVKRFNEKSGLKIPHMGWNRIKLKVKSEKLKVIEDGSYMYFVHSYYGVPEDKSIVLCETEYGDTFASGIYKNNIYAFQFHPEKSQGAGLKIVESFVGM